MNKKTRILLVISAVLLSVVLCALLFFVGVLSSFRIVYMYGPSMRDTLYNEDLLFVINRIIYPIPKAGDVVVISRDSFSGGEYITKRIIATEGQTVDIDFYTGTVYVDGVALEENYISSETTLFEGVVFPLVVEENCYFVMGDNRQNSIDSRNPQLCQIKDIEIIGKVIFILFPGEVHGSDNGIVRVVK